MKKLLTAGMVLLPQLLFAGTDCRVKEYPDHFLAICDGDGKGGAGQQLPAQQAAPSPLPEQLQAKEKTSVPVLAIPPATGNQATGSPGTKEVDAGKAPDSAAEKPAVSQRTRDMQRVERMKEIKRQTILDNLQ
jgi:hypothetical protein